MNIIGRYYMFITEITLICPYSILPPFPYTIHLTLLAINPLPTPSHNKPLFDPPPHHHNNKPLSYYPSTTINPSSISLSIYQIPFPSPCHYGKPLSFPPPSPPPLQTPLLTSPPVSNQSTSSFAIINLN